MTEYKNISDVLAHQKTIPFLGSQANIIEVASLLYNQAQAHQSMAQVNWILDRNILNLEIFINGEKITLKYAISNPVDSTLPPETELVDETFIELFNDSDHYTREAILFLSKVARLTNSRFMPYWSEYSAKFAWGLADVYPSPSVLPKWTQVTSPKVSHLVEYPYRDLRAIYSGFMDNEVDQFLRMSNYGSKNRETILDAIINDLYSVANRGLNSTTIEATEPPYPKLEIQGGGSYAIPAIGEKDNDLLFRVVYRVADLIGADVTYKEMNFTRTIQKVILNW